MSAFVSDRFGCRGLIIIFGSILATAGFGLFLGSTSNTVQYGSLFLSTSGVYTSASAIPTWTANNTAPHVRRATAIALAFTLTNAGGILSTWLLGSLSPAPRYVEGTKVLVVMSALAAVFAGINLAYLVKENRKKAELRARVEHDRPRAGCIGNDDIWFVYKY